MCRECGPNHRRCPSSFGPVRSARDRANYAAQKAAGLLPRRAPTVAPILTIERPVATVDELVQLSDDLQSIYVTTDTEETYLTRQRVIAEHGSPEAAVRHFGEQLSRRAEMHAGVTADDIEAFQAEQQAEYSAGMERLEEEAGARSKVAALEAAYADFQSTPAKSRRYEEVVQRYRDTSRAVSELRQLPEFVRLAELRQEIATPTAGRTGEMLAKLRDGYATALAEVRPMGGTMKWEQKTSKEARTAADVAAQVYPTDWIEHSNAAAPVRARISKKRAHYTAAESKLLRRKVTGHTFHQTKGDDMTVHNSLYESWVRNPAEDSYGEHAWTRTTYTPAPFNYSTGDRHDMTGKRGWEPYTHADGTVTWRRPDSRMVTVSSETVAELTMNASGTRLDENDYKRVTIHELGHRMQHVVPGITKIENGFIERRTTLADGTREAQVNVSGGGGKREGGWADSFTSAYMGRDYGGRFTEIISTGSEALFSGSYGGLVGAGNYHRDDEMRHLILGLFGSAGRKN